MGRFKSQPGEPGVEALRAEIGTLREVILRLARAIEQGQAITRLDTTVEQVLGLPTPERRAQETREAVVTQIKGLRGDAKRSTQPRQKCESEGCVVEFVPTREDQRFHDRACAQRARRARARLAAEAEGTAPRRRRA